jgi:hypothetical protein
MAAVGGEKSVVWCFSRDGIHPKTKLTVRRRLDKKHRGYASLPDGGLTFWGVEDMVG